MKRLYLIIVALIYSLAGYSLIQADKGGGHGGGSHGGGHHGGSHGGWHGGGYGGHHGRHWDGHHGRGGRYGWRGGLYSPWVSTGSYDPYLYDDPYYYPRKKRVYPQHVYPYHDKRVYRY